MIELLTLPFMQRALFGGILVGFLASYYGVFVVQRGLSFLGSGLAHAAFGGVALGLLLRYEPLWIAVPFTILVALGIAPIYALFLLIEGAPTTTTFQFAILGLSCARGAAAVQAPYYRGLPESFYEEQDIYVYQALGYNV